MIFVEIAVPLQLFDDIKKGKPKRLPYNLSDIYFTGV